jgi:two-component system cell cycle response regulator
MIRVLIVEDDEPAAELTVRLLKSAGLECAAERVASEPEFRDALARAPDVILSDSNVSGFDGMTALSLARAECPETPFIFVSGHLGDAAARGALQAGASGYVRKSDLTGLAATVRSALERTGRAGGTQADERRRAGAAHDASGTAAYLLERRAVLDRTLRHQDQSVMSSIMRRTPPIPVALLLIGSRSTRERFVKLLRNANIDIEEAQDRTEALASLEARTHALMFTDRVDLIRDARQLHAGAATHIVFIGAGDAASSREALRAGANDCMPEEPGGEEFWAHLTTARRIASLAASLQLALTDNKILSTIDELTRCGSRRFFEHQFPREVERAVHLHRPLTLVMCDIDHFKRINDSHGHQKGDEVLREFADRLTHGLRLGEDWVARIGGEEFAVVLPEVGHIEARAIGERLCERIRATPFVISSGPLAVTASFGVCALEDCRAARRNGATALPEMLVTAADAALYESKRNGRNRVTSATPISDEGWGGPLPSERH